MSPDKALHLSVGAVIERDGKYLLIDRAKPPYGFASIAGHIEENETAEQALAREIAEESGLTLVRHEKIFEEVMNRYSCDRGVSIHRWHVYACEVSGTVKRSQRETKSIGWYSKEEIARLELEPVWKHWFNKMNIITA